MYEEIKRQQKIHFLVRKKSFGKEKKEFGEEKNQPSSSNKQSNTISF